MYTEETVFVIGAGASWHYGYPTGAKLIDRMIDWANMLDVPILRHMMDAQHARRETNDSWAKLFDGIEELKGKLISSNPLVIDYFLGQNPGLHEAGKFLIALTILESEFYSEKSDRDAQYININRNTDDKKTLFRENDDWCRYIVHQLTSGCQNGSDLLKNRVRFINFNYDISLESQIHRKLANMAQFKECATEFVTNERIMHVYGSVRPEIPEQIEMYHLLELQHDVPFGPLSGTRQSLDIHNVVLHKLLMAARDAAHHIRTIDPHDKGQNEGAITGARAALGNAKTVCFLGYGFDENNNHRLNLAEELRRPLNGDRRVFFTNKDDHNRINRRVSSILFEAPYRLEDDAPRAVYTLLPTGATSIVEKSCRDTYGALAYDFEFPSSG